MKLSKSLAGLTLVFGLSFGANAGCTYLGVQYAVGATTCQAGGWLMKCSVAHYWTAIGQCHHGANGDTLLLNNIIRPIESSDKNYKRPLISARSPGTWK